VAARGHRLFRLVIVAAVGFGVSWFVRSVLNQQSSRAEFSFLAQSVPLPHHVPKYAGGLSFRFAMAHDVLHERYARSGPARHRERERLTRAKLAKLADDDPARFPLADDLAAALDRLGRSDEAVAVMRDKLARQQAKGLSGQGLYTSYANLGTFLIHANYREAESSQAARERFHEGVVLLRKSVEVNPDAHFGRGYWHATIAEFLLRAMENPELLKSSDCLGNRLNLEIEQILNREANWTFTGYGRSTDASFSQGDAVAKVPEFFRPGVPVDDPARWLDVSPIRKHITKVGTDSEDRNDGVPFDEPALAIIGEWRQGGGASPHLALALGETMLRVGQRYIAWTAYERASRLAEHFSSKPDLQESLRGHCRKRQSDIEKTLRYKAPRGSRTPWQHISPPPSAATISEMRPTFEAELAHGQAYQREYQEYEEARIVAGLPITDDNFYEEFFAGREPIASPVGLEEWFLLVPRDKLHEYKARQAVAWGVLRAGLAAMATALLSRWRTRSS